MVSLDKFYVGNLHKQTNDLLTNLIYIPIYAQTATLVSEHTRDQVRSQIYNPTHIQIRSQVEDQIGDQLGEEFNCD